MELRGLRWQSIDLTHKCNLHCDWCGKRTHESNYEMTGAQLDNMLRHINLDTRVLRISGGEPLMHPKFVEFAERLLVRFSLLNVATNGILLQQIPEDVRLHSRINYLVSDYTGKMSWSGAYTLVTPKGFYDPGYDPDLGDDDAKLVYNRCPYIQIKVIGDKAYDCCHAETIERIYGGNYGAMVGPLWKQDLEAIERWQACKHCFIARPKPYGRP